MANTVTVQVVDFARGIRYARAMGGRYDGISRTWEIPAERPELGALASYGLRRVSAATVVRRYEDDEEMGIDAAGYWAARERAEQEDFASAIAAAPATVASVVIDRVTITATEGGYLLSGHAGVWTFRAATDDERRSYRQYTHLFAREGERPALRVFPEYVARIEGLAVSNG